MVCNILQIAFPVWKYTPVGPPVPIVKNSADLAIDVMGLEKANITSTAEINDIIFFMCTPLVIMVNLTTIFN